MILTVIAKTAAAIAAKKNNNPLFRSRPYFVVSGDKI